MVARAKESCGPVAMADVGVRPVRSDLRQVGEGCARRFDSGSQRRPVWGMPLQPFKA